MIAYSNCIIIVITKLLKRLAKTKSKAPTYSRALHQIRGVAKRVVQGKFRSDCQKIKGNKVDVKADVV